MNLLALDTSTSQTGLALYAEDRILGELSWFSHYRQTVELAPAIDDLLHRLDIKPEALAAIGVAIGPGSFIRILRGLAFCQEKNMK